MMFHFEIEHFLVGVMFQIIEKLNLIGYKINLFEIPIKSVFNTFNLISVSDSENHFMDLGAVQKLKLIWN